MKGSFVKGATLMMLALLVSKIIGACYRIPLTNILGAEGMGLYQMVYPVYAVALTASSGALPLAISVLVSENNAKGNLKANKMLIKASFVMVVLAGVVIALLLAFGSGLIGALQGARSAKIGYVAIAPAIVFVSGIAVLKGWFQGHAQMFPTALSSLIEAVVKLAVGLTLAYVLVDYGVAVQVGGALFGVSVSEAVTFVVLLFIYKRKGVGENVKLDFNVAKEEYKSILRISLPITIGGMIFPLTQLIDSFLVVNILKEALGSSVATASYGIFSGPVTTLINLPVSLALAIGVAVVPHLSKNKEERNLASIKIKTSTALKVAVLIGVPFTALFLATPKEILSFLYGSLSESELALGVELLRISAPTVILVSVTQICTSVLQGLKDLRSPIVNLAIGGAVKLVLSAILLFTVGVKGVAISGLVAFFVTATLSVISTFRLMGKNLDIIKNSGVIFAFGGIIGISLSLVTLLGLSFLWVATISVISGIAYLFGVLTSRAFTNEEILSLPLGSKILKLKRNTG